jgi:hypothetical protein
MSKKPEDGEEITRSGYRDRAVPPIKREVKGQAPARILRDQPNI